MIEKLFFDNYDGQDCYLYVLHGEGIEVGITDFGAAVQYIRLRTKKGVKDVALGYPNVEERIKSGTYCGATIGRVANRIKGAQFVLNGVKYKVLPNEGENCNHGGKEGFDRKLFKAETEGDILKLSYDSNDGEQGFPGNLAFTVEYELTGRTLEIRYFAVSDKDTLWSPTCHTYFNLNGENSENINDCVLKINSRKVTRLDKEHIATGEVAFVGGTPFDFTKPKPIGVAISCNDEQLAWSGGFDVNYVLDGAHGASVFNAESGVKLDVYTDLPGLQFYSGNYIKGNGKSGRYVPRCGFCLEPQFFPNAVNIPQFETPLLKAGKPAFHYIRYAFGLII